MVVEKPGLPPAFQAPQVQLQLLDACLLAFQDSSNVAPDMAEAAEAPEAAEEEAEVVSDAAEPKGERGEVSEAGRNVKSTGFLQARAWFWFCNALKHGHRFRY